MKIQNFIFRRDQDDILENKKLRPKLLYNMQSRYLISVKIKFQKDSIVITVTDTFLNESLNSMVFLRTPLIQTLTSVHFDQDNS